MLGERYVIGSRRHDLAGSDLRGALIGRLPAGIVHLPVLVVGKGDGSVARPRPSPVRHDAAHAARFVRQFELNKEFGLGAVLIQKPPRAAASAVPAVRELCRDLVFALPDKVGHIRRLVLDALLVVGMSGRKTEIACLLAVDAHLVNAARRRIQARLCDALCRKFLLEAIDGIAQLGIDAVIARDPLRLPIVGREQPHLEGGLLRPLPFLVLFIPELYLPCNALTRGKSMGILRAHGASRHLAAVPDRLFSAHRKDAPGRLTDAALAVPCKFRVGEIHPHRLFQMFRSQPLCLHLTPLIMLFIC